MLRLIVIRDQTATNNSKYTPRAQKGSPKSRGDTEIDDQCARDRAAQDERSRISPRHLQAVPQIDETHDAEHERSHGLRPWLGRGEYGDAKAIPPTSMTTPSTSLSDP